MEQFLFYETVPYKSRSINGSDKIADKSIFSTINDLIYLLLLGVGYRKTVARFGRAYSRDIRAKRSDDEYSLLVCDEAAT